MEGLRTREALNRAECLRRFIKIHVSAVHDISASIYFLKQIMQKKSIKARLLTLIGEISLAIRSQVSYGYQGNKGTVLEGS